jgi:hypothetical protein
VELFESFVDETDRLIRETMGSPDDVELERSHNEAEWSRGNAAAHVTWLTSTTASVAVTVGDEHEPLRTVQMDELGIGEAADVIVRHLSRASLA